MGMIGSRNGAGINVVLFLAEHIPEIFVIICFGKFSPRFCRLPVIHVAKRHDIYIRTLGEFRNIVSTLSTCADSGYIQFIAWCHITATQYMTRYNEKTAPGNSGITDKPAAGGTELFLIFHMS